VNGKDYAVSTLEGPDLSEHRRKELALVRLMGRSDGRIRHGGCNHRQPPENRPPKAPDQRAPTPNGITKRPSFEGEEFG
jgi:hypothetical protein